MAKFTNPINGWIHLEKDKCSLRIPRHDQRRKNGTHVTLAPRRRSDEEFLVASSCERRRTETSVGARRFEKSIPRTAESSATVARTFTVEKFYLQIARYERKILYRCILLRMLCGIF